MRFDRRSTLAFGLLLLVFAVLDVWPQWDRTSFRYTGSDPEREVWNLGWPLPLAIYDRGLWIGPFAYVVLPGELAVAGVMLGLEAVRRRRRGTRREKPVTSCDRRSTA